jgi:hypothetical protein
MHIQRVFHGGEVYNYINDIFVIAYEDDGRDDIIDITVPFDDQFKESHLSSTLCNLEELEICDE